MQMFPLPGSLNIMGKLFITDQRVEKSSRISGLAMWDENNGVYVLCDRISTDCSFFKLKYAIEVKFDAETGDIKPELITESEKIGSLQINKQPGLSGLSIQELHLGRGD